MAQPFLFRKRIILTKAEATPGTAESLVKADFNVRVYDVGFTPNTEFENDLKYATGDHSEDIDVAGARWGTLTFKTFVNDDGTVNGKPNFAKYTDGCGINHAVHGATGNSFKPSNANDGDSNTLIIVDIERGGSPQGVEYRFVGGMGNVIWAAPGVGKPFETRFEMKGKLVPAVDNATPLTNPAELTSPDSTAPFVHLLTTTTIGGQVMKISSFELDAGNNVEMEIDPSDATGIIQFSVVERKPRLNINPLKLRIATADMLTKMNTNVKETITIANASTIPGKFTIPQAQILTLEDQQREQLSAWGASYKCLRNGQFGSLIIADMAVEDTWEFLIGSKT